MQTLVSVYEAEKHCDSVLPTRLSMDGLADDVDPDSIVLFDDVRSLIEIVIEATKDDQLSEIINLTVQFLACILELRIDEDKIQKDHSDCYKLGPELAFLRLNSLTVRQRNTEISIHILRNVLDVAV